MEGENDEVIAAAAVGADWALTVLYRELHPALIRYLAGRVHGEHEDVASDVWIEVAKALPTFVGDRNGLRRLMFTIAHRRCIDVSRRRGRRPKSVELEVGGPLPGSPGADETVVARAATDAVLAQIRALLPPLQAEVVILRVVAGLSLEEVASIVGRRPAAVSVLQHRALRRLARQLGEGE